MLKLRLHFVHQVNLIISVQSRQEWPGRKHPRINSQNVHGMLLSS